eukprot:TRINITY_DN363_c0_g3_i2.p1 TRINITY_DN363_c0_g3~~TRINITY_DN363_c0_g3_i2.p1  ORF type:complete len:827 (+),score=170.61 TRINITY_DN363_c0_g3_i2:111-2591(+)
MRVLCSATLPSVASDDVPLVRDCCPSYWRRIICSPNGTVIVSGGAFFVFGKRKNFLCIFHINFPSRLSVLETSFVCPIHCVEAAPSVYGRRYIVRDVDGNVSLMSSECRPVNDLEVQHTFAVGDCVMSKWVPFYSRHAFPSERRTKEDPENFIQPLRKTGFFIGCPILATLSSDGELDFHYEVAANEEEPLKKLSTMLPTGGHSMGDIAADENGDLVLGVLDVSHTQIRFFAILFNLMEKHLSIFAHSIVIWKMDDIKQYGSIEKFWLTPFITERVMYVLSSKNYLMKYTLSRQSIWECTLHVKLTGTEETTTTPSFLPQGEPSTGARHIILESKCTCWAISHDRRLLAIGFRNGSIQVRDAQQLTLLAISFVGNREESLPVEDEPRARKRRRLEVSAIRDMTFSPNNLLLFVLNENDVVSTVSLIPMIFSHRSVSVLSILDDYASIARKNRHDCTDVSVLMHSILEDKRLRSSAAEQHDIEKHIIERCRGDIVLERHLHMLSTGREFLQFMRLQRWGHMFDILERLIAPFDTIVKQLSSSRSSLPIHRLIFQLENRIRSTGFTISGDALRCAIHACEWIVGFAKFVVGVVLFANQMNMKSSLPEFDRSFRLGLYDWDKSFLPGLQDMLRRVIVVLLFHPLHHAKMLEDIVHIFQKEKDETSAAKLEDWIKNPLALDESFRNSPTSFRTREFLALMQVLNQMEEVPAMGSVSWPLLSKASFSTLAKSGFAVDHDTLVRMAIEGSYYHSLDDSLCEFVSFHKAKAPRMLQFDGFTKTAIPTAPCMRCVRCGRLSRKNDDGRLWPFRAFATTCRWCDGPLMVISQLQG